VFHRDYALGNQVVQRLSNPLSRDAQMVSDELVGQAPRGL
jgi:hypothetical protein